MDEEEIIIIDDDEPLNMDEHVSGIKMEMDDDDDPDDDDIHKDYDECTLKHLHIYPYFSI